MATIILALMMGGTHPSSVVVCGKDFDRGRTCCAVIGQKVLVLACGDDQPITIHDLKWEMEGKKASSKGD